MKIGLSYSRCVRDIVDGDVDIDDVLVIIARTDFDPRNDEQWAGIWQGYRGASMLSNAEWSNYNDSDEEKFRQVSVELWNQGKLHQPRKFDSYPRRMPYIWLETVLVDQDLENNSAAKQAWDHFQLLAGLTNVSLNTKAH